MIMNVGFKEGYEYFQKNCGAFLASYSGGEFGTYRANNIDTVNEEISALEESINAFLGDKTPVKQLKGDIAEFWHAGTFNVNAATNESLHRTIVDRSNKFGSVDVSSNFGSEYGLKYYLNGVESAKQQAKSVFQRFKNYQNEGGKDSLEKYLADRKYTTEDVLNDPVYSGQIRVIPKEQLEEATAWLKRMIATESTRRPEQVKRYQDTLDLLRDRISDNDGNESIPLSREDAEKLAAIAKEGKFKADDYGITAPELLNAEMVVKEALKSGLSAAAISMVLKVGPELYRAIDYLIKNGEIDEERFKNVGFAAISGASEGFIRGSVAAAISTCCKAGVLGETLKEMNASVVGAAVALTMNTLKNAYQVAIGKKSRAELSAKIIQDMFVSGGALIGSIIGKSGGIAIGTAVTPVGGAAVVPVVKALSVVGSLLGTFVGSVSGSFVYNVGYKTAISFCTETGITLFGLVEQDYSLPDDIIADLGLETFDFDSFETASFEPETFKFDTFSAETIEPDTLGIKMLRRGVIGISRIGYVN